MNTEKESHIDYLGFLFDGQKVRIRNKSIYKFYRKAYRLIDRAKKVKKNKNIKKFHIGAKYIIFTQIWVPIRMGKHMETSFYMPTMHKKIFDNLSPNTKNLMKEELKNRKKHIEKRLGYRLHIKI